jgi:hypothetical protein
METLRLRAPEIGLHRPNDEAGFSKIVREPGTYPECCFISRAASRTKRAPTNVAHVYRKLLLDEDEFLRLLKDC